MVFGNWVYDEVQVSFPQAVPIIDSTLETLSIPTHDQWNKESIAQFLGDAQAVMGAIVQKAEILGESLTGSQREGRASLGGLDEVEAMLASATDIRVPSLEGDLRAYSAPLFEGNFSE
jgi:hypothetical protein